MNRIPAGSFVSKIQLYIHCITNMDSVLSYTSDQSPPEDAAIPCHGIKGPECNHFATLHWNTQGCFTCSRAAGVTLWQASLHACPPHRTVCTMHIMQLRPSRLLHTSWEFGSSGCLVAVQAPARLPHLMRSRRHQCQLTAWRPSAVLHRVSGLFLYL